MTSPQVPVLPQLAFQEVMSSWEPHTLGPFCLFFPVWDVKDFELHHIEVLIHYLQDIHCLLVNLPS